MGKKKDLELMRADVIRLANDSKIPSILFDELLKFFINQEEVDEIKDHASLKSSKVGYAIVMTPTVEFKINIYVTPEVEKLSHAAIILTKEGERFICFNTDLFFDILSNGEFGMKTIRAICAHEIGHLIADHLGANKPKGLLTVNDEEQERAIKVIETVDKKEAKEAYKGYMSTTLRSILSGGCLQDELVADLISLRFCKIQHVVNAHLLTTNKNVFTKIEKFNRVKALQDYVSTETIPREGYGLQLVFDTKLIEIFSESNPDLIKVS